MGTPLLFSAVLAFSTSFCWTSTRTQTSLGHSLGPELPELSAARADLVRRRRLKFRHSKLPESARSTASKLVPPKGKLQYSALVDGVGMLLIELSATCSYGEFSDWAGAHRLGFPVHMQFGAIWREELDDPAIIPKFGIGAWGWMLMDFDARREGRPRQVVIGFPVDYDSPAVIRYQQKPKS